MKAFVLPYLLALILTLGLGLQSKAADSTMVYKPVDQKLYETIVRLDSLFFQAYNTCELNIEKYASFYSDSLEFYHDKGGLSTSKKETVDATKRNVCGKVKRVLVAGSIEVYPIKDFGAVEMGLHRFKNLAEGTTSPTGKFIIIWKKTGSDWKISRVVSLH